MSISSLPLPQNQSNSHPYGMTGVATLGTPSAPRDSPCEQTVVPPAEVQSAPAEGAVPTIPMGTAVNTNPNIRYRCLDRTAAPSLQLAGAQRPLRQEHKFADQTP